jgi:hypothetical protein
VNRGWEAHERHVQQVLGLDSTVASGAKFHDPGDAVDRRHHTEADFRILADAKYTEKGSYSLNSRFLRQMGDKSTSLGRRFVLPVRFWPPAERGPEDWAVIGLDDLCELVAGR